MCRAHRHNGGRGIWWHLSREDAIPALGRDPAAEHDAIVPALARVMHARRGILGRCNTFAVRESAPASGQG